MEAFQGGTNRENTWFTWAGTFETDYYSACAVKSIGDSDAWPEGLFSGICWCNGCFSIWFPIWLQDCNGFTEHNGWYSWVLVLPDFSKAFDSVDHDLLCHKLERFFDFSSSAVGFIRSFLTDWSQCVSAGGVLSGFLPVLPCFSLMTSVELFGHPSTMYTLLRWLFSVLCCGWHL
jgi:hypothetical protein